MAISRKTKKTPKMTTGKRLQAASSSQSRSTKASAAKRSKSAGKPSARASKSAASKRLERASVPEPQSSQEAESLVEELEGLLARLQAERDAAAATATIKKAEEEGRRRGRGRPPKQETLTGVPAPDEYGSYAISFKLLNRDMDRLERVMMVYRKAGIAASGRGKEMTAAQAARRLLVHMLDVMERKLDRGKLDLSSLP